MTIALSVNVDAWVLCFTLILSLLTGLVFGLAPAWQISGTNLNESLKTAARTASSDGRGYRLRDILVVSEMVLATVLLVAAGLLLRSLHEAEAKGPGYNTNRVTLAAFDLRGNGYTDDRAIEFYDHLLAQLLDGCNVTIPQGQNHLPSFAVPDGYTLDGYFEHVVRQGYAVRLDRL